MAKLTSTLGLSLIGAALLGSPSAHAGEPAPPSPPAAPRLQRLRLPAAPNHEPAPRPPASPGEPAPVGWYGWETLLSGGATYALMLGLIHTDPLGAMVAGTALTPLTTMSMHMIHGDVLKGYVSLVGSYAIITGGAFIGANVACSASISIYTGDRCAIDGALTGLILGGASAVVLDSVVLAWGGPSLPDDPPPAKASLWPSISPSIGGATLGIAGVF